MPLEATPHAAEIGQRLDDGRILDPRLAAHRDGRKGVTHVVHAGKGKLDREVGRVPRARGL